MSRAATPQAAKPQDEQASQANACHVPASGDALKTAVPALGQVARVAAYPSTPIAPAGADYTVALNQPFAVEDVKKVAFYRVLMDAEGLPKLADRTKITAHQISEDSWLRKAQTVQQGATELTISLPPLRGWWFQAADFTIIGCSGTDTPLFAASFEATASDSWAIRVACIVVVALVYSAAAFWCRSKEDPIKKEPHKMNFVRYFDPVVLSSGPNGKGSISRLQVLIFSIIVFYVLLYSSIRLGALSDMSVTVLELLGISAVGAQAAKVTDNSRNRLSWENWTWLINAGWLPRNGLAAITQARWADLITADDGVDVYHFQMLIFSLVVAVALLMTGLYGLATFKVPENLLLLLGLSQAVYVGGKIVAQPSCGDLDVGLTKLQELEKAYYKTLAGAPKAAAAGPAPVARPPAQPNPPADPNAAAGPPAAAVPDHQPRTLEEAEAFPEYVCLQEQYKKVIPMFESVMGMHIDAGINPPVNLATRHAPGSGQAPQEPGESQ